MYEEKLDMIERVDEMIYEKKYVRRAVCACRNILGQEADDDGLFDDYEMF